MDEFLNPWWDLDQLHGWMRTRDPEMVRLSAIKTPMTETLRSSELEQEFVSAAVRREWAGWNVEEELWQASGWQKPNKPSDLSADPMTDDIEVPLGSPLGRRELLLQWEQEGKVRLKQYNPFPALDYMLRLFQSGTLGAFCGLDVSPFSRPIRKEEFNDAVISAHASSRPAGRLTVWAAGSVGDTEGQRYASVYVARNAALDLFPPSQPAKESPPPFDLDAILEEIRAQHGPQMGRARVWKLICGMRGCPTQKIVYQRWNKLAGPKNPGRPRKGV
jgi:hypothetical protein